MRFRIAALSALFLESAASYDFSDMAKSILPAKTLAKRANTTDIPLPINVEASQYWDGADGPWYDRSLATGQSIDGTKADIVAGLHSLSRLARRRKMFESSFRQTDTQPGPYGHSDARVWHHQYLDAKNHAVNFF